MKKTFDNIFKIGQGAFTFLVIVFGLFLLSTIIPLPGNFSIKVVQSGSMEPAIKTGSVIVIKPVKSYKIDDVITFGEDTKDSIPTTHRIIDSRVVDGEMRYVTKGDANEDADIGEVFPGKIIGKVFFDIPYLGFVLDFARKPFGFALFIGLPLFFIILDEVKKIIHEVKKANRSNSDAQDKSKPDTSVAREEADQENTA